MRTLILSLLLTAVSGLSRAAAFPDFDGTGAGLSVRAVIERAASAGGLIPEPAASSAGSPVWVSMEKSAAGALDSAVFKSAPVAQNKRIAIYEFDAATLDRLAGEMHKAFGRGPGFFAHDSLGFALEDLKEPPAVPARSYTIDQADRVKALLPLAEEGNIVSVIKSLSAFKNRNYRTATGIDASRWVRDLWTRYAGGRPDITVETFKHQAFPQESVILTMRGAAEPDKIVVIGGHEDSTAGYWGGDVSAPGADDNASGVAVISEVIRALVKGGYRPARTIKFMAYAAEEAGLRGSADIAAAFKQRGADVEAMMNLDMVNYKGSEKDIYFVSDNTSQPLNDYVGKLIDSYTGLTWGTLKCGYGCSDHASWTKNGYPSTTPFESSMEQMNPYIHKADDTLDKSGGRAEHAIKFARLGLAFAVESAK